MRGSVYNTDTMKKLDEMKQILAQVKPFIQKHYHVTDLALFGSYVRNEQNTNSDIDVLVAFGQPVGFFTFLDLEEYLGQQLGTKVDLVTKDALKPAIGKHILQEAIPV